MYVDMETNIKVWAPHKYLVAHKSSVTIYSTPGVAFAPTSPLSSTERTALERGMQTAIKKYGVFTSGGRIYTIEPCVRVETSYGDTGVLFGLLLPSLEGKTNVHFDNGAWRGFTQTSNLKGWYLQT